MGSLDRTRITQLDTDDTSSYGPEIISSFHYYEGTYAYYIHNYSEQHHRPAGATVVAGGRQSDRAPTWRRRRPASGDPRYWHVFDFTVTANGAVTITDVNVLGMPAKAVGIPGGAQALTVA